MKVKRVKRAGKTLTFYKFNFHVNPPYKVIVDGTFCMAALNNQVNLREQVPKYLGADSELVTTTCVMEELEKIGPAVYGALAICRNFDVVHCPHMPRKTAADCLHHLARRANRENGKKYFMATQDDALKAKLRTVKGTPIMFLSLKNLILEKPVGDANILAQEAEVENIRKMKSNVLGISDQPIKKKKFKVKGKNPLCCKKKAVKEVNQAVRTGERTASGKRKRNKRKVADDTDATVPSVTSAA